MHSRVPGHISPKIARPGRSPRIRTPARLNRAPSGKFIRVNCCYIRLGGQHLPYLPNPGLRYVVPIRQAQGHPVQSRRVLTYPETGPYMPFLFPGSSPGQAKLIALHSGLDAPCGRSRLRRAFRFAPPSDLASRRRPCLRLILVLINLKTY